MIFPFLVKSGNANRSSRILHHVSGIFCILILLLGSSSQLWAEEDKDKDNKKMEQKRKAWVEANRPYKVTGTCSAPVATADLDVNNVRARLYNNGALFWRGGQHVYNVPKRDDDQQHAIFASGLWIGGKTDGELKMAASAYGPWEFWPGPLDENGDPPADCSVYDRMYKVSAEDLKNYNSEPAEATPDLIDWPFDLGAPVVDGDGNPNNYNLAGGDRPDITGDQSIWWIMNDMGNEHQWSLSQPIGLEIQVTAFAFQRADALNNTTFYKYKIINKGGQELNDTYFGIWADPDLGNFNDDFVGSDPEHGIGFVWNGADVDTGGGGYGDRPPALGYDFFQGPLVNTDSLDNDEDGLIDEDDERIGMQKFIYYNGDGTVQGNPTSAQDAYRFLQGLWRDDVPITFGGTGRGFSDEPTDFMFPGNPPDFWSEENTDNMGTRNAPADRRFLMSSGPFTLEAGATQEIVFGIVWSQAGDRYLSLQKMKEDNKIAQTAFDAGFNLPSPPDPPRISSTEIDGSVILTWRYDTNDNNFTDSYDSLNPFISDSDVDDKTYSFEGYRLFRYRNSQFKQEDAELVANFDLINGIRSVVDYSFDPETGDLISYVSAKGEDNGVIHSYKFDNLINATDYFFGLQAYAYNAHSAPKILNGSIAQITVRPSKALARDGGTLWNPDNLQAELTGEIVFSISDGSFSAKIVDPVSVTGDRYRVEFYDYQVNDDTILNTYDLTNLSSGVTILEGRSHADNTGKPLPQKDDVIIADGLSFNIQGSPIELNGFLTVSNANGPLAEFEGAAPDWRGFPIPNRPSDLQQAENDGHWMIHTYIDNPYSYRASYDSFLVRTFEFSGGASNPKVGIQSVVPNEFEIRFTGQGKAIAHWHSNDIIDVPFEWWNVGIDPNDPSDDYQMIPLLFEIIEDNQWTIMNDAMDLTAEAGWADHSGSGANNDPWTEPVYVLDPKDTTPGSLGYSKFLSAYATHGRESCAAWYDDFGGLSSGNNVHPDCDAQNMFSRTVFFNWNGGDVSENIADYNSFEPEIGTVFRIASNKPNLEGVIFELDAEAVAPEKGNAKAAEDALDQMGIVPNPYKGGSAYETTQLVDVARFINMPETATIDVYTLSGTHVNTLTKSGPEATFDWNLRNETGLPIASGIYLIHIDVPGVGERVLKFGVVKKRIQLDVF